MNCISKEYKKPTNQRPLRSLHGLGRKTPCIYCQIHGIWGSYSWWRRYYHLLLLTWRLRWLREVYVICQRSKDGDVAVI